MQLPSGRASRRHVVSGGVAALAAVLAPRFALADEKAVNDELKKLYGDKKAEQGKVKLDVPQIAENGLVVPVNVEVESPMTDGHRAFYFPRSAMVVMMAVTALDHDDLLVVAAMPAAIAVHVRM